MILLVDDNTDSRQAFAELRRIHGYEIMEAADVTEGLDILDSIHCDLVSIP